jgi:hypothetical protein
VCVEYNNTREIKCVCCLVLDALIMFSIIYS